MAEPKAENAMLAAVNGKKSYLSMLILGIVGVAGKAGWMTGENVATATAGAEWLLLIGVLHKLEKAFEAWMNRKN